MGELFKQVCSFSTISQAWKKVKKKKAASGLDDITVDEFAKNLSKNLNHLINDLKNDRYSPEPLKRIQVPKFGKPREARPISIPSVRDKIVQHAVKIVLEPIFSPIFLDCSYAYRPGKGPRKAYKRVNHYLVIEKRRWVTLADFDNFFDSLDQKILISQLLKYINDMEIIKLIRMWCKIGFVSGGGEYHDVATGISQGSVLSPLLSNIYAHPLDEYMVQKAYRYVRYSDNMLVACYSRKEAKDAWLDIREFSTQVLNLKLNQSSSPVKSMQKGFVFLGIYYRDNERRISDAKIAKMKSTIKRLTRKSVPPDSIIEKLNESTSGFRNYYGLINPLDQMIKLDDYLAKRLTTYLAFCLQNKKFKTISEMLCFLNPVEFTSTVYCESKEKKIKEIASNALKLTIPARKKDTGIYEENKRVTKSLRKADQAIKKRKQKYIRSRAKSGELVISTLGAFVGKRKNRLVVSSKGKTVVNSRFNTVKNIIIESRGVTLSSDLISECSKRKISLFFSEPVGLPYAMIYCFEYPKPDVAISQIQAMETKLGNEIASAIVTGKIRNQLNLVKFYARSRKRDRNFMTRVKEFNKEVKRSVINIKNMVHDGDNRKFREKLMLLEGRIAASYWSIITLLLKNRVKFPGRKRKGAKDLVNSLLNYAYAILYGKVWKSVIVTGMNPYVGFLHASHKGKPALVFDLVEEFRCQVSDRAVFTMLTRGEKLRIDKTTGLLTGPTRRKIIENVQERLSSLVPYRGKNWMLIDVIQKQARLLAKCLKGKQKYRPFIGRY